MSEMCVNGEHLVTYLYGECSPSEREAIESHVAACRSCRNELAGLRAVRSQLTSWEPPEVELGFQMVRAPDVAVKHRWRPSLPAWGMAAAILLLAAAAAVANLELSVGPDRVLVRTGWSRPVPQPSAGAETLRPWQADLMALERSLRAELVQDQSRMPAVQRLPAVAQRAGAGTASARAPEESDALLHRVRTLVQDSERRQQQELALRVAQLTREIEAQRQADQLHIRQGFSELAGMTGAEVARQRQLMNYLIRVSQR